MAAWDLQTRLVSTTEASDKKMSWFGVTTITGRIRYRILKKKWEIKFMIRQKNIGHNRCR